MRIAGELAILGAALLVAGLLPAYRGSESLWEKQSYDDGVASYIWYACTTAALILGAGICTLAPRTRRLIGPGLLLGAVAASTMGLVYLASDPWFTPSARHSGYWLELAAHLVLVLAACLTALALMADPDVRFARAPRDVLAWWVLILGSAGALALVFHTLLVFQEISGEEYQTLFVNISATAMALVVPACAAMAAPRRFGVALLAGWIAAGATFFLSNLALLEDQSVDSNSIIIFGLTLLGLVVVAIYLDRAAPRSSQAHPT